MPFYEYECSNCKFYVEAMQKISDEPLKQCPSCGQPTLVRLISAPVFRLKGGGWYETDFKSDKESKRNLSGGDTSEGDSKASKDRLTKTKAEKKVAPARAKPKPAMPKPAAGKPLAPARKPATPATRAKAVAKKGKAASKGKAATKGRAAGKGNAGANRGRVAARGKAAARSKTSGKAATKPPLKRTGRTLKKQPARRGR